MLSEAGRISSGSADARVEAGALFDEADLFLDGDGETLAACRRAIARARDGRATILVAGLRSTGKSSLVSALWGDSELLPTAVRDCTQTNTFIRTPRGGDNDVDPTSPRGGDNDVDPTSPRGGDNDVDPTSPRQGERDRRLLLNFLTRDGSEEFASRGLAFHRLREVIVATLGPAGPKLDEGTPGAQVRLAVDTVRRLFSERKDVHVLHEPATEQLEQLEQFIAHLDSREYVPGGRVEKDWAERREYLMGRRRRDGRTLDTGKLLSLRLVELVRATDRWGDLAPTIIDTPWVPTFHNARRADLVLREAERADIIVITALPEPFELEPWVLEAFDKLPRLRGRTLVVFNQVDTVDTSCLFGRGGFAEAWAGNVERLGKEGIGTENLYVSCARLPFLEGLRGEGAGDPSATAREDGLRAVLGKIGRLASDAPADALREKLIAACDPADCGVESVRSRLARLMAREVRFDRAREACEAMLAVNVLELDAGPRGPSGVSEAPGRSKAPDVRPRPLGQAGPSSEPALRPSGAGGWREVRARAAQLLSWLRAVTSEASSGHGKLGRRSPTLGDGRSLFKE